VRLAAVNRHLLTVDLMSASGRIEPDPANRVHAKVRRWDQRDTAAAHLVNGAVELPEGTADWISLENGILVNFDPGEADHPFQVGDYWAIPARTATGDIDWPRDPKGESLFRPPQGPLHHYAPLGYVDEEGLVLLQKAFRPLASPR
jgi:hypothetical protein